jgi:hypothetical protein
VLTVARKLNSILAKKEEKKELKVFNTYLLTYYIVIGTHTNLLTYYNILMHIFT